MVVGIGILLSFGIDGSVMIHEVPTPVFRRLFGWHDDVNKLVDFPSSKGEETPWHHLQEIRPEYGEKSSLEFNDVYLAKRLGNGLVLHVRRVFVNSDRHESFSRVSFDVRDPSSKSVVSVGFQTNPNGIEFSPSNFSAEKFSADDNGLLATSKKPSLTELMAHKKLFQKHLTEKGVFQVLFGKYLVASEKIAKGYGARTW